MAGEKEKLHIRLHVYDTDIPVTVMPEDEPYCRNAAKLITEKVNKLSELYRTNRSEKEILYMAMLDIAISLNWKRRITIQNLMIIFSQVSPMKSRTH